MKSRSLLGIFVSVVVLGFVAPQVFAEPEIGKPAPEFGLAASDGKMYHLSDFKGKFVVLEWFNKNCPFIRKHYDSGNMQKLQADYRGKGVVWLSICSSAPKHDGYMTQTDAVAQRVKDKSQSMATLLDPMGKVGRLYGAKTTPHMFIISPEGMLIYKGAIDDTNSSDAADIPKSKNYVSEALDAAMAGRAVPNPSTPPYGCAVKY